MARRLGLVAIVGGPLVGASLAFSINALGDVHPADVGYTYTVFTVIGGIAGLLGGIAFGTTSLISPRDSRVKGVAHKPADVTDEL